MATSATAPGAMADASKPRRNFHTRYAQAAKFAKGRADKASHSPLPPTRRGARIRNSASKTECYANFAQGSGFWSPFQEPILAPPCAKFAQRLCSCLVCLFLCVLCDLSEAGVKNLCDSIHI